MATLRLFASIREAAGVSSVELAANTVEELVELASQRFGADFEAHLTVCKVWVNGEPAKPGQSVSDSDEVALLPPVSGG